jgi:hypothetical protein
MLRWQTTMDRKNDRPVDREPDKREDAQRDKQAAAASTGKKKAPEQDETASDFWDTDQRSDAPGPFGTG